MSRHQIAPALLTLLLLLSACGGSGHSVSPPPPDITVGVLVPSYTVAGGMDLSLFINGSGFSSSSVVLWNGISLPTTFGTSRILTASVASSLVLTPATVNITVSDPSSGARSNAAPFGIASAAAATAGVVQLISVAADGTPANGDSLVVPSINSDGRFVAFQSAATNLVPGPASGFQDIYLRDTCLGSAPTGCRPNTSRVSATYDGSPTNGHSRISSISSDGRFVAFDSQATNILPLSAVCSGPLGNCVFVRDTCNQAPAGCVPSTVLASAAVDGTTTGGDTPSISGGGRFVVFDSVSTNIVDGDTNAAADVFVRDTCFGAMAGCTPASARASISSTGAQGDSDSRSQTINTNGRFVAFQSFASNLVAQDTSQPGMFVRDTCLGGPASCAPSTIRVDIATDGTQANGALTFNIAPSITADGRLVAFATLATNLVSANVGGWANVYVRDTCVGAPAGCTASTSLASLANDGSVGNNGSSDQSINGNGRFVAFSSLSSNLVPGDTFSAGGFKDIFVHDTCFGASSGCAPSTVRVSVTPPPVSAQADDISDYPAISGDGHYVVFLSASTNLVNGAPGNGHAMVYLAKTGF